MDLIISIYDNYEIGNVDMTIVSVTGASSEMLYSSCYECKKIDETYKYIHDEFEKLFYKLDEEGDYFTENPEYVKKYAGIVKDFFKEHGLGKPSSITICIYGLIYRFQYLASR